MLKILLPIGIVVVVILAIVLALTLWKKPGPGVGSYRDLRKQMIDDVGTPTASPRKPVARPAGLDTRLPAAEADHLRRLVPPPKDNWKEFSDCYYAVTDSIRKELAAIDPENDRYDMLSPGRRAIVLLENLEGEVNNGGFDQYFLNSSGDGAALTPASLRLLGLEQVAAMVEKANSQFPSGPPEDREVRMYQMGKLTESAGEVWSGLDDQFYKIKQPEGGFPGVCAAYILAHPDEFYKPR